MGSKIDYENKIQRALELLKDSRNTMNDVKRGIKRNENLYFYDYPEVTHSLNRIKLAITAIERLEDRDYGKLSEVI